MTSKPTTVESSAVQPNGVFRPSQARGLTQLSWLKSRHSFSFADYHDPLHHHFGVLRVINDDVVQADAGFDTHPHRDMEIITYVVEGALAHRDSLGRHGVIPAGDIQQMSAGTGILHSEFNAAPQVSRFIQMWIVPDRRGYEPRYQQQAVNPAAKHHQWLLLASPNDEAGLVKLHQDARIYATYLTAAHTLDFVVKPGRSAWLQVVSGSVWVNQMSLQSGDGLAITQAGDLQLHQADQLDLLLFDLPAVG